MSIKLTGNILLGNITGGPSALNLSDLHDVSIVSPQTSQFLRYNGAIQEWQNAYINPEVFSYLSVSVNTTQGVTWSSTAGPNTFSIGLGAITPTSVAATGTVTGSNLSGTNTGNQTITLTGDVTGSGTDSFAAILSTVNGSPQIDAFRKVSVTGKGLVTATSAVTSSDITTVLGFTPVNKTGDTMTGDLTMSGGFTVTGLPDPTLGADAANKNYVDAAVTGLTWKASVVVASLANINLAVGGLLTIDGVTVTAGARVLVKNQSTSSQNGIYIAAVGTWLRSADTNTATELNGASVYVQSGTQASTGWVQTATVVTIGTDPVVWSQFSGAGTYSAGTGLTLTGNTFSLTSPVSPSLGGTGTSTAPTTGQVLIATSGGVYTPATVTNGTGISLTSGSGTLAINNTGVTSLAGTTNQITVSASTGAVTVSLPSAVTIAGIMTAGTFSGSGASLTSIPNGALTNSSLTVGSTSIALGATSTTLAGLTTVTSASFVGPLSGNATTATTANNIAVGAAGSVPYQSSPGTTAMLAAGTSSQVLISGTTPSWTNTPTLSGTNFSGIPNAALTNNTVTIGSTPIALGATSTTLAGLTSVTSASFVGPLTGSAATLTNPRSISATGDGSWTVTFDGSANVTSALTLATVNSNIGTFAAVTVNAKGLVTAAQNMSGDLTSSGTTATFNTVNSNVGTFASATVNAKGLVTAAANLSGDITTSGSVSTLATVNGSPQIDTFLKATVNGKGLVTATSAVTASDITTSLGFTPVNKAGDTMTGLLVLSGAPVAPLGAATKQYVDDIASGLNIHNACVTATGVALASSTYNNGASGVGATLTATANGAIGTIGGYASLVVSDRVLVKDQASTLQNGIYTVTQLGSAGTPWILTRAADFDGAPVSEITAGDTTYIQLGTLTGTLWVQTTAGTITVGTSPIVFTQFGGPGSYTGGTGISVSGTVITNTGVTSNVAGTGITVSGATGAVTINTANIPNASLTNSSVTVGSTNIALGATSTTLAGLTSVTSTTFVGALTGTATNATNVATTDDTTTNSSFFPAFVGTASGNNPVRVSSTKLTFNPSTGVLTALTFSGAHSGSGAGLTSIPNAALVNSSVTVGSTNIALGATSTTLAGLTSVTSTTFTGSLSGNANTATSATTATNVAGGVAGNIVYQSAASTTALLATGTSSQVLVSGATPDWTNTPTLTGTNFSSIPNGALSNSTVTIGSTGISLGGTSTTLTGLTSVTSTTFVGALTGNASTASSAATLTTARLINGTSFNGSADITVTAAAGTLTGATLAAGVTASSLTSVGTLTSLVSSGDITSRTSIISRSATSTFGYVDLSPGSAANSGYIEFYSFTGGVRQGYIGFSGTNATLDTGTLPYIAGTHAFTGAVTITGAASAASFNATSTERVKKAIKNISQSYLDKFVKLKPREYDRKDYEAHEFGFIAEEMALVYPEVVGRDEQGIPNGVDYGKLSTILTAKVQEQQATIDKLTSQVAKIMELLKGVK